MNVACRFFLIFLFFTVAGCGPLHLGVKEEQVNVERYPNVQEFLKNQNLAAKKIPESNLLQFLKNGTQQKLVQINKAEEVQKILFGDVIPHAEKKDIADISGWILAHHVFSVPYKNVRTEFYFELIPIAYNTLNFGPDMDILFITKRDENDPSSPYVLERSILTGTENNRTRTKEYIWTALFNGIVQMGKKLIF